MSPDHHPGKFHSKMRLSDALTVLLVRGGAADSSWWCCWTVVVVLICGGAARSWGVAAAPSCFSPVVLLVCLARFNQQANRAPIANSKSTIIFTAKKKAAIHHIHTFYES